MEKLELTHRTFFRRKHLRPLLEGGVVQMTNPDNPQASNQKYVLTEAGVVLKARQLTEEQG
jgi:ATP-dependent DNA helicase RecG